MTARKRPWVENENSKPDAARLALISELRSDGPFVRQRVRTVGWCAMRVAPSELARLIAIEPTTSLALLEHNGAAVLVDLALPLSARPDPEHIEVRGVPRLKSLLTVFGDLNVVRGRDIAAGLTLTPKAEDRRSLDAQVPHAIAFDETVRLCALRFVVEDSLDITLWAKGVEAIRLED